MRGTGIPRWKNSPIPLLFLYRGEGRDQEQHEERVESATGGKEIEILEASFMARARAIHARLVTRDNKAELI
jgi:hypothetical protein